MRRLVIAAAVGAAVVGTAVPSLAAQSAAPKQSLPVGVTHSTNGGVFVGVTVQGQNAVAASVANGQACFGISLQVPICAGVPGATTTVPHDATVGAAHPSGKALAPSQSLPIVYYHDDTETVVGFRDVGVVIFADGRVCPVVSTQTWQCTPAVLG